MFTQVYCHPVRRAYDVHLKDFLKKWLPGGFFPVDIEEHLSLTDNEVLSAIAGAARDPGVPGHEEAWRLFARRHFRQLYQRNPSDYAVNPEAGRAIYEAACREFGVDNLRRDSYKQKGGSPDFPVLMRDGRIASSLAVSDALSNLPVVAIDFVFVAPEIRAQAERWLEENRLRIIRQE